MMDEAVQKALQRDQLIDITTAGRKTGVSRRIEIWFHNLDGRVYITGSPGPRDWYANLKASPQFTFHLKQSLRRDLRARATPITDTVPRRRIFNQMRRQEEWMRRFTLKELVEGSPLVEVEFPT